MAGYAYGRPHPDGTSRLTALGLAAENPGFPGETPLKPRAERRHVPLPSRGLKDEDGALHRRRDAGRARAPSEGSPAALGGPDRGAVRPGPRDRRLSAARPLGRDLKDEPRSPALPRTCLSDDP